MEVSTKVGIEKVFAVVMLCANHTVITFFFSTESSLRPNNIREVMA